MAHFPIVLTLPQLFLNWNLCPWVALPWWALPPARLFKPYLSIGNSWSSVLPWCPELRLTLYFVSSVCTFSCVFGEIMLKLRVQFLELIRAELVVDSTVYYLRLKVNTGCTWWMPPWWVTWPVRISGCTDGCGSAQVRAWDCGHQARQIKAGLLVKRIRKIRRTCN